MRLLVSLIGLGIFAIGLPIRLGIRAVGLPIRLAISIGGFPIRLLGSGAIAIGRRLTWLRPVAHMGLKFLVILRSNSIASTAITLSAINLGLIVWQIWPEDTGQMITELSQPTQVAETLEFDKTSGRITELENQIRELSREQRFQFDRIRDCINYPSPFGCQ